jgi:tetratricopeptide (TPR) repeat protein
LAWAAGWAAGVALLAGCASPPPRVTDREVLRTAGLGHGAFERGQFAVAADQYRESLARARLIDDPAAIGDGAYNLAACLVALGDTEQAKALLREARAEFRRAGSAGVAEAWLLEARAARDQGRGEEARRALDEAAAAAAGERSDLAPRIDVMRAALSCDAKDAETARTAIERAKKEESRLSPASRGELSMAEGRLARMDGRPAEAAAAFDRAADAFRRAGLYREMAAALAQCGECFRDAGDLDRAGERFFRAGRSLFAQGDLTAALKQAEAALSATAKSRDEDLKRRILDLVARIREYVKEERGRTEGKGP